jgi:ADP-heptose:LPS heptosyltransferase
MSPRFALAELPAALANLGGLVTIDSGLKHLAVCARVPTVTVFGATDPREWHMGTLRDRALWRGLSCSPCRRLECPFGAPCMDIAVADVEREILDLVGRAA